MIDLVYISNMEKKLLLVLWVFLLLGLGACAKPPVEEMDQAVSAVTRAENDPDAAVYAEDTLIRARDALASMRTEAEAKRYEAAKTFAAEAVNAAEKAIADGRAAAVRAREEAAALLALLPDAIAETERMIRTAAENKLSLDFDALWGELENARRTAEQAEIAAAGNKPREALEKGSAVRTTLSDIRTKLSQGATAASRKK
jgi:hypothetical protein